MEKSKLMEEVKRIVHQAREEIRDADKYARCALHYKIERPEFSRTYQNLASAELEHMMMLHNLVGTLIEEDRRTTGEPTPGMAEAYELIHDWQMDDVNEVKNLLQSARE